MNTEIIGCDLGNYWLKTSKNIIIPAKVGKNGNIINNHVVNINGEDLYFGATDFDTEYRKVNKLYLKEMFLYSIYSSTRCNNVNAVVGLPIGQYKADKELLKQILLSDRSNQIDDIKLTIEDVEVYPEGLAAVYDSNFLGIIVDIGGRTTDIAQITEENGAIKVNDPYSVPKGTLNLYADFIKAINSKFSLDIKNTDAERLLKNGLKIDGEEVNIMFAMEVFKEYVEKLVKILQVDYSIKTNDIMLIGGGSQMLYKPFKRRIAHVQIIHEPLFANAIGFQRVGENIWL